MPRANRFYGVVQLLVAFFLCAGVLYAALDRRYRDGIILLLLSIPLVSYALRSFGKLAPRAVEVPERVAADYRLEISEQALRFDDTSVRISRSWGDFGSYVEGEGLILLYQKDGFVRIIPTRVMSAEQLTALRELLRSKLEMKRGPRSSKLMF